MRYEKISFSKVVSESDNLSDVCRNLALNPTKGNRDTVKKYIINYDLDVTHFRYGIRTRKCNKYELSEILIKNSPYASGSHYLKKKLYNEGLKESVCELCSQTEEWKGKRMSLILDHINGVNNDNRIENLRIVCPNCNATLNTHGGKNIKNGKFHYKSDGKFHYKSDGELNYCKCGDVIDRSANRCKPCDSIYQRRVDRPSYKQLLKEIEETNYCAVGRKYGVSDNAIRKWVKNYEKVK